MNLQRFMPLPLLLSLATGLCAQSDSSLDRGWQSAQNQLPIPPRTIPTPRGPPTAFPTDAATNAPVIAPLPATGPAAPGGVAGLPSTPPAAGAKPFPATAGPDGKTNEPAEITYDFPAVPVDVLLDFYADLVHRTLLHTGVGQAAVSKDATITLKTESPLTRTEAIEALETILGMNGITIVPIGDKFAKVVAEVAAPAEGGLINTNTNNIAEAGKMVTQIIQVKYTALEDLGVVLKPFSKMNNAIIGLPSTQTLILRDYAENVNRMVEMVRKIDRETPLVIKPRVIKIKYALASDISSALSALGAGGGGSVGKSTSGSGFGGGTGTVQRGNTSGFGATTGGVGAAPGQTANPSGLASAATSARSPFQNNLNRIVQNAAGAGQFTLFGQTKIIADERTNSLLVFANDEDMAMITNIIGKLDVVLQQVLIDAIIMEVDLDSSQSVGISYAAQGSGRGILPPDAGGLINPGANFLNSSSGTTNAASSATGFIPSGAGLANLPVGASYFAKYGNDLNVVMQALASDTRSFILSRPRIQTSHAVPADMFIGKTVPYITGSYNYGYSTGPSSQYSQLEIGIHLQILPLINPDGLVVMDIQVDVEGQTGSESINGNNVPITSKQQAGSKVAVRDGETIMLGGFIQDNPMVNNSGVPGLMNIPVLGALFKSKTTTKSRQELVMLLRPTVLPDPEAAAKVATLERNKLSSIKKGELDILREEEDRNKTIDAQLLKEAEERAKKAKKDAEKADKDKAKLKSYGITNAPSIEATQPGEE
jgi:general secretion pathway protein D